MEKLSRLSLLVAIFICSQWVCSSGTTITSTACLDNTTCTAANAVCINKTCACSGAFKDSGGSTCVEKGLGDLCTAASDCNAVTNALCHSQNHICSCSGGFKEQTNTCVTKGLGDPCTAATDCKAVTNALCHSQDHICSCSGGLKEQTNTCVAKGLGDPCTAATDCKAVTNALCHNQDHICSCSDGFKEQTNTCVAKVLGAACSSSNKSAVCGVSNTDCISGHCACLNNSYVDENDECKTAVGTTCTKASDCVKNADCNKATSKCICSTGYVDSNGKCSEQKSSADSVKKTINAIVALFLCAALLKIV